MKNINLIGAVLLILSVLLLSGCTKEDITSESIEGKWVLTLYKNNVTGKTIKKTANNSLENRDNFITFHPINGTRGIFGGNTAANSFSGEYSADGQGNFTIFQYLTTEVGEPFWGGNFTEIIHASSFKVKGRKLTVYYNSGNNSLVFDRVSN